MRASIDRSGIAVTVVIFTVRQGELSVLLIRRAAEPYAETWALPGGLLQPSETLDQAAARKLVDETGVSDVYLEQLYTFDASPGPASARSVVAYFALVDESRVRLEARPTWQPAWFPVRELPELAFANNAIVSYALRRLQAKLSYSNVVYSLLPEHFTLTQLQRAYEAILGQTMDKRNFRKRILSLDLLAPTNEVQQAAAHRPARLYRFARREPLVF
jgi:8-oxo-dGTP diphosphatase